MDGVFGTLRYFLTKLPVAIVPMVSPLAVIDAEGAPLPIDAAAPVLVVAKTRTATQANTFAMKALQKPAHPPAA